MDKFQYLTYLDKDEYIIPKKGKDLRDVMTDLEDRYHQKKIDVYEFKEAHFCPDLQENLGEITFFILHCIFCNSSASLMIQMYGTKT